MGLNLLDDFILRGFIILTMKIFQGSGICQESTSFICVQPSLVRALFIKVYGHAKKAHKPTLAFIDYNDFSDIVDPYHYIYF